MFNQNEYHRKWRKLNPEKDKKYWKKYYAKNKDILNAKNRKTRKLKKKLNPDFDRTISLICEYCKQNFNGFRKSQRFCSRKCMGNAWSKPSELSRKNAYRRKWIPSIYNKIPEHRWVMEQILGRKLSKTEVVHHIDKNKKNNAPSNLMLFKSNSEHIRFHKIENSHR